MTTRIKFRRDTEANWASANPVLALGEPGYDTTNNEIRIGDGVNAWADLSPISGGSRLMDGNVDVTRAAQGLLTTAGWSDNNGYIYFSQPTLHQGNLYLTGSMYDQSVWDDINEHYNDAVQVSKQLADEQSGKQPSTRVDRAAPRFPCQFH